jgi:hypothetical protein
MIHKIAQGTVGRSVCWGPETEGRRGSNKQWWLAIRGVNKGESIELLNHPKTLSVQDAGVLRDCLTAALNHIQNRAPEEQESLWKKVFNLGSVAVEDEVE